MDICYTILVMSNDNNRTNLILQALEFDYIKDVVKFNNILRNETSLYDDESLCMCAKCIRVHSEEKQKYILDNIYEYTHCALYNIEPSYGDCIMFIKELNMDEAEELIDDALGNFERLYDEARKTNKSQSESSCLVYTFNNLIIKDDMFDCCVKYSAIFDTSVT